MRIGATVRVMGPQSTADVIGRCARSADAAGLDDLWVADHIAIPPDDAEGSGGRYLDPLVALGFIAAKTERIGIGTGVLNLPYRAPLPTAKQVATLQELSGGRLRLGIGVGWMEAEFQALGIDRTRRGAITDDTLRFILECFDSEAMTANGQTFLFLPRPERPPIFVGGQGTAARRRAVRFGDAWMPVSRNPEKLAVDIAEMRELADEAGRSSPTVAVMSPLPLDEPGQAQERVAAFAEAGVDHLVHAVRYDSADGFEREIERLLPLTQGADGREVDG